MKPTTMTYTYIYIYIFPIRNSYQLSNIGSNELSTSTSKSLLQLLVFDLAPSVRGINIFPPFTGMVFSVASSKFQATLPAL